MAFKPKFSITPKLSDFLIQTAVLREKIINLTILPKREVRLMRSARLRMVHSSTAIEGNPLSFREVEGVLQGKMVTGVSEKDRREVINYEKAMVDIDRLLKKKKKRITVKDILKIHKLTTVGILPHKESGNFRKGPVYIVSKPGNKVIYKAPKAKVVVGLVRELIEWLESKEGKELSPIIVSGIVHHQLVTIHPFTDGNGRTARVLATLVLYLREYDIKRIFALEDYYNLDRGAYYDAIQSSREKKDLTLWLEYFSQGLLKELQQVYQKVEHFNLEVKKEGKESVYLSKRHRGVLDFAAINGKVFRMDVVEAFTVSPRTAHRDLKELVLTGFLERKGKGPKTHYIFKK